MYFYSYHIFVFFLCLSFLAKIKKDTDKGKIEKLAAALSYLGIGLLAFYAIWSVIHGPIGNCPF